jgi:hypothetical protein
MNDSCTRCDAANRLRGTTAVSPKVGSPDTIATLMTLVAVDVAASTSPASSRKCAKLANDTIGDRCGRKK